MMNDADERKFDGKKLSVICFTKILLKNLIFCEKINLLLFNEIVLNLAFRASFSSGGNMLCSTAWSIAILPRYPENRYSLGVCYIFS